MLLSCYCQDTNIDDILIHSALPLWHTDVGNFPESLKDPLRSQRNDKKFSGCCKHPPCIRIAVKEHKLQ